ncbi:MATE family efflux transporter [Leptospira wolffii]|uniref:MATE family efflux transporter n=1 Tax=Leptospira wolffii TaxID=409998 RepID=UPI001083FBAF|nr:MATE family efflux transporter [Leptospira wolffii]TGL52799.1 MATE family efflux transporter [Leptospira wolffii]
MDQKFFRLTFYNILTNLTVPLTGLADTAILGQLETHTFMAGVALSNILFYYLFWAFSFLRMSTTGLTAQSEGGENKIESGRLLLKSGALALVIGVIILVFKNQIRDFGFLFLEGEADVKRAGLEYFDARIYSTPAVMCNFVLTGWFLGKSQSVIALIATAVANVSNFLLNIWFILHLGWKSEGAGLATTISQYLMLLFFLLFLLKEKDGILRAFRSEGVFDLKGFRSLLSLNSDIMIRTVLLISTFSIFRNFSSGLGSYTLAANAILHEFILVGAFWIDGAALATETISGNLKGSRDRNGLWRILKLGIWSGLSIAFLFSFVVLIFPDQTFGWISKTREVVRIAKEYSLWLVPILVFGSVAFILDGFFLGMSEGRILRNSMFVSSLIFFLPFALWGKKEADNHLLWFSLATYMLGRSVTLGYVAYKKLFLQKSESFS